MADYFCFLSGADFPMKSHAYIKDYLARSEKTDYIQGVSLPSEETGWLEGGRRRLEAYMLPLNAHNNATIEPRSLSWGNIRQLGKVLLVNARQMPKALWIWMSYPKRRVPDGMKIYAGEMWWTLSKPTLAEVLEWNRNNPWYHRYQEDSQVPDEMYFNTLVWKLSKNVSPDIKRYISWGNKKEQSPKWMSLQEDRKEIDAAIDNPEILFARKMKDSLLTDYIMERLS